jgi:hypothetical protein
MSEFTGNEIVTSFSSSLTALSHIKYSFFVGIGIFLVCFVFCRSKKSFFDVIASRKVMKCLRTLIFFELCCLGVLFYFYFEYGSPILMNAQFSYGSSSYSGNWLFSFPRPVTGLVLIGMGLFGDNHSIIRVFCMIGCGIQMIGDACSAYQVNDYRNQQLKNSAPHYNGYTPDTLLTFYWRDIVSIAVCTAALLLAAHMTNIVGWCNPPLIHPSLISGAEYDRYAVMKRNREDRSMMEKQGFIESSVPPSRWNLKVKTETEGSHYISPRSPRGPRNIVAKSKNQENENERTGLIVEKDDKV